MHVAFADSSKRHIIFVDSSVAVNRALLPPSFNLAFLETLCPSDCPLVHLHNLSDSLQIDNDANKLLILNSEMRNGKFGNIAPCSLCSGHSYDGSSNFVGVRGNFNFVPQTQEHDSIRERFRLESFCRLLFGRKRHAP